jgi:hypothetical protein
MKLVLGTSATGPTEMSNSANADLSRGAVHPPAVVHTAARLLIATTTLSVLLSTLSLIDAGSIETAGRR